MLSAYKTTRPCICWLLEAARLALQCLTPGAAVIGVSSNDVASHVEFRSKLDLPFSLLADDGGQVSPQPDSQFQRPACLLSLTMLLSWYTGTGACPDAGAMLSKQY